MTSEFPILNTPYRCDVCLEDDIGTKNQATCRKARCIAEKKRRISAKSVARARVKREKTRKASYGRF